MNKYQMGHNDLLDDLKVEVNNLQHKLSDLEYRNKWLVEKLEMKNKVIDDLMKENKGLREFYNKWQDRFNSGY